MKLAIATSYELLGPKQVERWNRFGDELLKRGTQLFLMSTNPKAGLTIPNMQIPYGLSEFNALNLKPSSVTGEKNLLDIEEFWVRQFNRKAASSGLAKCRRFYEDLLDRLEPDVVSIWNTQLPQGRIFQLLCEEQDIPVFTIERGLLPDTLLLDRARIHSASELSNSLIHSSVMRSYRANVEIVSQYREYYQRNKPAKYGKGDPTGEQSKQLSATKKPILLVLGQAQGGGVLPRRNHLARRNFPGFEDYSQVLKQLHRELPGMQLAFRDHPINRLENEATEVPSGTLRPEAGPLYEVIEAASVVVVLGASTALFETLVLEKPLVVVGNTQVSAIKPYFECRDGNAVPAVKAALAEGFEAIRGTADRALSFLLEHVLVAENPGVPAKQQLTDLAEFLADYDLSRETSLEERFTKLQFWGESV